ncbi:cell envelope integrity protein TolA [Roseateles sp. GG27B]
MSWLHTDPLRPPEAPGIGRGIAFALAAHALLVIALSAGVHWRTSTPPAYEAELWSAVPQAAAPREVIPPAPEPEPVPEPVLKAPAKTAPPPPPPPEAAIQAERDAEIAIAKARDKKKELELKRVAADAAEVERKKALAKDQALKDKLERERLEKLEKQEKQEKRAADDKREVQDKLDKIKEDKLKAEKLKADELKKEKLEKAKQEKAADDKREARLEGQRQENLRRIQGMAGASGGPSATGTALQSSGPTAGYGGRIKAVIRPNIIDNDSPVGNPVAEVEVRAAPGGVILSRKLLKSSGDAEWDKAELRAIDKTETLPRDVDGRVPAVLVISFQPRE